MYDPNSNTWVEAQYWHTRVTRTVLEKSLLKEVVQDTRLAMLALTVTHVCVHRVVL